MVKSPPLGIREFKCSAIHLIQWKTSGLPWKAYPALEGVGHHLEISRKSAGSETDAQSLGAQATMPS